MQICHHSISCWFFRAHPLNRCSRPLFWNIPITALASLPHNLCTTDKHRRGVGIVSRRQRNVGKLVPQRLITPVVVSVYVSAKVGQRA